MIGIRVLKFAVFVFLCSLPSMAAPSALELLKSGRADEALSELQAHIKKDPSDAEAWNLMARVYFQLERWDDAIRAGEKSVELKPSSSEYHLWLGRAYGEKADASGGLGALGLVRKVKSEFEKAVELDPKAQNLPARADLAEFYTEAPGLLGGDKGKARALADFVMKYDAPMGHAIRARLAREQKKYDIAEKELRAAIEASGDAAHYWVSLASFYRRTGRLDEMEAAINRALEAAMQSSIALFDGASLLLRGGRNFPAAAAMMRRYLSLENPSEEGPVFEAHFLLGVLLEKQGDTQSAVREYRAALALASQYKKAQDALARISR